MGWSVACFRSWFCDVGLATIALGGRLWLGVWLGEDVYLLACSVLF